MKHKYDVENVIQRRKFIQIIHKSIRVSFILYIGYRRTYLYYLSICMLDISFKMLQKLRLCLLRRPLSLLRPRPGPEYEVSVEYRDWDEDEEDAYSVVLSTEEY